MDQNEILVQLQLKKEKRRIKIILGIAIWLLLCTLFTNLSQYTSLRSSADQEEAQVEEMAQQLELAKSEASSLEVKIQNEKQLLNDYQAEIAALPTPAPTPSPTPKPEPTPAPTPNVEDYEDSVTYEQLFRMPQQYAGKKLCFLGEVATSGDNYEGGGEFYLMINGVADTRILVFYPTENGRVLRGDVVKVYGTVIDTDTSDPKLQADFIYFPDSDEIIDTWVDNVYGDTSGADEFKDSLKQWQDGMAEVNGEIRGDS